MTTMNNEDPADPSAHEPRELPEPAAKLFGAAAVDAALDSFKAERRS